MQEQTRSLTMALFITTMLGSNIFLNSTLRAYNAEEKTMLTQKAPKPSMPASRQIRVGATYKHYSGKMYTVIALAHDSEDPSLIRVIYQSLYDCPTFGPNAIWARPYTMFAENVVINGKEQARFEEVASNV